MSTLVTIQQKKIYVEKVVPIRFTNDNIIIFNRVLVHGQLETLSNDIAQDVHFKRNIVQPLENKLYAMFINQKWNRAVVKHAGPDKIILHLLDCDGVHDFRKGMVVREIEDQRIIDIEVGQIKMFIHAIAQFPLNELFKEIFRQVLFKQEVTAVFSLIEDKSELVHETYAGDFIYSFGDKMFSFREILLREQLTSPKQVTGHFNRMLFEKRAAIMAPLSIFTQAVAITDEQPATTQLFELIGGRFKILKELLGEGTV